MSFGLMIGSKSSGGSIAGSRSPARTSPVVEAGESGLRQLRHTVCFFASAAVIVHSKKHALHWIVVGAPGMSSTRLLLLMPSLPCLLGAGSLSGLGVVMRRKLLSCVPPHGQTRQSTRHVLRNQIAKEPATKPTQPRPQKQG